MQLSHIALQRTRCATTSFAGEEGSEAHKLPEEQMGSVWYAGKEGHKLAPARTKLLKGPEGFNEGLEELRMMGSTKM